MIIIFFCCNVCMCICVFVYLCASIPFITDPVPLSTKLNKANYFFIWKYFLTYFSWHTPDISVTFSACALPVSVTLTTHRLGYKIEIIILDLLSAHVSAVMTMLIGLLLFLRLFCVNGMMESLSRHIFLLYMIVFSWFTTFVTAIVSQLSYLLLMCWHNSHKTSYRDSAGTCEKLYQITTFKTWKEIIKPAHLFLL